MDIPSLHKLLLYIQHSISFCGVLIIFSGVIIALTRYIRYLFNESATQKIDLNKIRLNLGIVLTLGLEFIVAADLIGTTTAPDYYSVGIVASIVLIRTVLSFTLNREINAISKMEQQNSAEQPVAIQQK
ncbi:DUF1622 domain-containing protein [Legionella drancourtii]|uniref:DUF1622 domain-containing protein n=1 Tax=Legionella drancourtii LLAP12 TaxID=658187 RepID=G9EUH5_9GAMM|nr:DUF1622 domain-containing protein [Legionella drancourtii]EHL28975.1 hypothetical protein LDG_8969 [Legionella drancourtii LLAP12]